MKHLALVIASVVLMAVSASASPTWSLPVDSRTAAEWMAEGPGSIYALAHGHLAAIDASNGRVRWSSDRVASGAPAVVHDAVVIPASHQLLWLRALDGQVMRTLPLRSDALLVSGSSSIVAALPDEGRVMGFDARGVRVWSRSVDISQSTRIFSVGGDAVAILPNGYSTTALILDARDGKPVASATHVDDLVGADGRYLWFGVDVGGIKGLDLDTNRRFVLHGAMIKGAVRVEHGLAVAVVDGRLQYVDLSGDGKAHRLHIDGRWIGGPIGGKILVERGDGLYVQALNANSGHRVAAYPGDSVVTAADRGIAYVGRRDGEVLAVDVRTEQLTRTITTPCRFFEGFSATGKTMVVHCDAEQGTYLIGFPRDALIAQR